MRIGPARGARSSSRTWAATRRPKLGRLESRYGRFDAHESTEVLRCDDGLDRKGSCGRKFWRKIKGPTVVISPTAIPTMSVATTRVIYVLTTGGTMEKVYSEQTGSVANVDSKIDRYLKLLRLPDCEVNVVPLMNKDSLEMTDADRVLILGMVRAISKENAPIVITHGTDTMVQTGLYLQRALPELKLPIVLTGAMTPLGFEGSDGLQNLTESLIAAQLVRAGVYVAFH